MNIRDALDALILAELDINDFDIHDPMLDDIIDAQRTVQDAAPELAAEVIRLRKAIIEYEMALASEGALILNHEGHIAKLNAQIELLRKWQSEAVEIIKHVVHIPEDGIYDRLIAEAKED